MSQQMYIREVMEAMGWTDGTYIPIANEENKKLMESVNYLLQAREKRTAANQASEERVDKLRNHYKNAQQDIDQNLKLLSAHRSQLRTESHMQKLCEHDDSRIKQQLREIEKEKKERIKYEEITEKEIKRLSKNIERLSEKIEWAKTVLVEWRQAMSKGEEINKMIEKFCIEDQGRATCLDTRRRLLQEAINKQKKLLIESYEDQKSLEQALDRTAELYRQAHQERRQMVNTWKDAVNQMNQRERDIETAELDYEHMKDACLEKTMELEQNEAFLNQLIGDNKEVEAALDELNNEISAMKRRLQDMTDLSALKENELSIQRKMLQALAQKVEHQRRRNKQSKSDKEDKEIQIMAAERNCELLKERYDKFLNVTMSAQERLQQLEELIDVEEKSKEQLAQEITRLNGILFRSRQQLLKFKDEEKCLQVQNRGIEATIQSTKSSIKEAGKQLQRTIELAYNTAFKVQLLEMKIWKIEGKTKMDVSKMERATALEKETEAATKHLAVVQNQICKLEDDMKKITCSYDRDMSEIERMSYKSKEVYLYCEGGKKQLKATIQQNQEKIVELSILKMRVHEMEKQIEQHSNKAYNLEKHRMELEKATNERLIDIKSQVDLLIMKRKHLLEERGTLKADLGERHVKIDALKKRYELAVDLLGKNEDGSLVTATQLKIEAAQEKQMLLHEGNELNDKVLKAENDIKAMENTLCLINFSNDSYRKTFEKLDDQTPELSELKAHQENYCFALQKLRTMKSKINLRLQDIDEGNERLQRLEKDMEDKIRSRLDHKEILMKVYKELMDQKTKLQRAERELRLAQKSVQQKCLGQEFMGVFEKTLNLREVEEKNTTALQLIADLVDMNPEMCPEVSQLLYDKGLKIPQISRARSQASWRSDYSEASYERGMRMLPSSVKGTFTSSSTSTRSSSPTICSSSVQCKMTGSACPSVVSIDFPVDDRKTITRKASVQSSASRVAKKERGRKKC